MLVLIAAAAHAETRWSCEDAAGAAAISADLTASTDPTVGLVAPLRLDGEACALSAGAELTVRADLLDPDPALSLDRAWVGLTGTVRVRVGRIATPTSHWIRTTQQGQWAATAIARPGLADEDTGLLFTHGDGVILETLGPLDAAVMVSLNEDAGTLAPRLPQIIGDDSVFPVHRLLDEETSLEGGERLRLDGAVGLRLPEAHLGIGGHLHRVAEDATLLESDWTGEHTQAVLTAHAWGGRGPVSVRTEAAAIWLIGVAPSRSVAGAAQVEGTWGMLSPWLRGEGKAVGDQDAYYTPMSRDLDRLTGQLGVRVDVAEGVAVKLSGVLGQVQVRDDFGVTTTAPVRQARLQVTARR